VIVVAIWCLYYHGRLASSMDIISLVAWFLDPETGLQALYQRFVAVLLVGGVVVVRILIP